MALNLTEPLGFVLIGLMLGMRHATDSDHVVAVTTFVSQERKVTGAVRIGLLWGVGHSATVLIVGALIIFCRVAIPVRLGLAMEFAVALVLVGLGARAARNLALSMLQRIGLRSASAEQPPPVVHSHLHSHGSLTHSHSHAHSDDALHTAPHAHYDHRVTAGALSGRRRQLKSLGVGLTHGLAGSAAIALLVLSTIQSAGWAMAYLAVFCVGTMLGMGFITMMIAMPVVWAASRVERWQQVIATGTALFSFGFGLVLAWHIGFVDHLFGSSPVWLPE